jgi:hypothetical protein
MCMHEEKQCQRCGAAFQCKAGSIMQCQCSGIQLTLEERAAIEKKFDDCLCIHCLKVLQTEYRLAIE